MKYMFYILRSGWLLFFVLSSPSNASLVSMCDRCNDSRTPAEHCSQTNETVMCRDDEPYCLTQITSTGNGLKVIKGCASEVTCLNKWWIETQNNPNCSSTLIVDESIPVGTTCTFCCHDPEQLSVYCNRNNTPDYLMLPESHSTSAMVSVQSSATSITTLATSTLQASVTASTAFVTASMTSETTSATLVLNSTAAGHTVNSPHSCPVCSFDSATDEDCVSNLRVEFCGLFVPYCMTSFYREETGVRIEKRCASRYECSTLWLTDTLLQQHAECLREDLQAGNGSHLECHYCCENSVPGKLCNNKTIPVIPDNLLQETNGSDTSPKLTDVNNYLESTHEYDMNTSLDPTTTVSTAIPTFNPTETYSHFMSTEPMSTISGPTNAASETAIEDTRTSDGTSTVISITRPAPRGSCVQCGEPEFSVPCSSMELLLDTPSPCMEPGKFLCMTDAATDSDGVTGIYKRCVDQSTCHTLWYLESSDQNVCRNFDSVTTDVSCHFCCIQDDCNTGTIPSENTLYNGHL